MSIMPCRYEMLQQVLAGFQKTGVQLIGYDGHSFCPSGTSDDVGLYYFVPKLVRLFGISLDHAVNLFFYGMVAASFVLALVGFFLLSRSWIFRAIATIALTGFCYISCRSMTDVYLVQSSIALAVIPIALYFMRKNKVSIPFGVFIFLSGLCVGFAHHIRSFSSFAVFLFLVLGVVFMMRVAWERKTIFLGLFFVGLVLPFFHFSFVLAQRKDFFGSEYDGSSERHVFWHNLYAGFGFLSNDLGIYWNDKTVIDKIKEVEPEAVYPTKEYEAAVRTEVFKLIKNHFHFVLQTMFAKLGVIFYYLLMFANIGLLAAFFYRKSWVIELMFWSGIAFNSLFGFLALPGRYYLTGMLAFTVLYAMVSIEHAIRKGAVQDLMRIFSFKRLGK